VNLRSLNLALVAVWILGSAPVLRAQQYKAIDLMTGLQKAAIGVDRMSTQEKTALNDFLIDLVSKAYKEGQKSCGKDTSAVSPDAPRARSGSYLTGSGHWISTNGEGKIITLEDGSMWQINSIDQVDTVLWLPVTDITVIADPNPIGDYKYILVNKDDGEKAHAKYLGRE
jgi:hypothetical protein